MKKSCGIAQSGVLVRLNTAAFFLHMTVFFIALVVSIVYSGRSVQVQATTDFRVYGTDTLVLDPPPQAGPFMTRLASLGYFPIIWVDLPFPFITAIFHGIAAFGGATVRKRYDTWVFSEGRNPMRWSEYSVTASLMTVVILFLSGVTNIFLILGVGVVGNILLQAMGYLMEVMNMSSSSVPSKEPRKINWMPMILGWFVFLAQWSVIFSYFFTAITSPRPPTAAQVPWFVYSIVIGLFFQYSLFGLVQLLHYLPFARNWFGGFFSSNYGYELSWVILSFTSKFYLVANIVIGTVTNPMASA